MNHIAESASISSFVDIEESSRGSNLFVGEDVVIDSFVKIKFVGGTGDIHIGPGCYINSGTVIYSGNGLRLGKDVLIAANCTIAPVNHEYRSREAHIRDQGFIASKGGVVIEDDVWVGAGSVILDGAVLRQGCVVGAGSVVTGELEPYSINVGSPAKPIGARG